MEKRIGRLVVSLSVTTEYEAENFLKVLVTVAGGQVDL